VTPQQREQLDRIKRSQEHLLGIINDLLNLSRIEAGQLQYDLAAIPLRDVVSAVILMITPQARGKGLKFKDQGCPPDAIAWADRAKVEQIVLNLVSNAVKFTEAGGTITLSCETAEADHVVLVVRDTGSGIPADKLDAIFEPFVQVGRTLTNVREGAGLGLAISRDLARAMHGDLYVEPSEGGGAKFTLTLPAA
jgi:signal transduction histidine kinase